MGWTPCVSTVIGLVCVTFLFEAVGFAIPLWVIVKVVVTEAGTSKTYTVNAGTWYVMSCIDGQADSCRSHAIEPQKIDWTLNVPFVGTSQESFAENASKILGHHPYWWAVAITATVGVGLTALATLILICCRCAGIHSRGWFVLSSLTLFFGSISTLGSVIVFAIAHVYEFAFTVSDVGADTFPWSVLLFGIGGLIGLLTSLALLVVTCKWRRYGAYDESDTDSETDVPMDNIGKSGYDNHRYENQFESRKDYSYAPDRNRSSQKPAYGSSSRDYVRSGGGGRDYERSYRDNDRGAPQRERDYQSSSKDRDMDRQYRERGYVPSGNDYIYRPYAQRY